MNLNFIYLEDQIYVPFKTVSVLRYFWSVHPSKHLFNATKANSRFRVEKLLNKICNNAIFIEFVSKYSLRITSFNLIRTKIKI